MKNIKCKKCGKPIIFAMMPNGMKVPLDAVPLEMVEVKDGVGELVKVYRPHWLNCNRKGGV